MVFYHTAKAFFCLAAAAGAMRVNGVPSGAQQQPKTTFIYRVGTKVQYFSKSERMWCDGEVTSLYPGAKSGKTEATVYFQCPNKPKMKRDAVLVSDLRPRRVVAAVPGAAVAGPTAVNDPKSTLVLRLEEKIRKLEAENARLRTSPSEEGREGSGGDAVITSTLSPELETCEEQPSPAPEQVLPEAPEPTKASQPEEQVLPKASPEQVLPEEPEHEWGLAYADEREWRIPAVTDEYVQEVLREYPPLRDAGLLELISPFYKLEQLTSLFPRMWKSFEEDVRNLMAAEANEAMVQNSRLRQGLRTARDRLTGLHKVGLGVNNIRALQVNTLKRNFAKTCEALNEAQKNWRPKQVGEWYDSLVFRFRMNEPKALVDDLKRDPVELERWLLREEGPMKREDLRREKEMEDWRGAVARAEEEERNMMLRSYHC